MPTLPAAVSRQVLDRFALLEPGQYGSPKEIRLFFSRFEQHPRSEGFVLQYPDLVWGANSYENVDKEETINVWTKNIHVTAQLDVHSYFVLKADHLLLVEGRKGRKTILQLSPQRGSTLHVASAPRGVCADWNERKKLLEIIVDHAIQKLVVFRIIAISDA